MRYLSEDLIHLELLTPFLCALVSIDERGGIQYHYSTLVADRDIIK